MNEFQFIYSTLAHQGNGLLFLDLPLLQQQHSQHQLPSAPHPGGSGFGGEPHKSPVVFINGFLTEQSQTVTCAARKTGIFPVMPSPPLAHVFNISRLFANRET